MQSELQDLDLLQEIDKRNKLTVHLTITTMNAKLARVLEPRAPRPDLRIRTVKQLREENARLKKLVADLSLDKDMLQSVIRKNSLGS